MSLESRRGYPERMKVIDSTGKEFEVELLFVVVYEVESVEHRYAFISGTQGEGDDLLEIVTDGEQTRLMPVKDDTIHDEVIMQCLEALGRIQEQDQIRKQVERN